jgi:hypothetical protein
MARGCASCSFLGRLSVASLLTIGCVREEGLADPRAREELIWDFSTPRRLPKLRLWPSSASTPERLKRALTTENDHGRLVVRVDGKDPYFVWRLENAIPARLVAIDVELSEPGDLQLFWSSAACPTFRESCSVTERVSAGRQWIDFLLDRTMPVRELRLDLPESRGITSSFYEIGVFERADLSHARTTPG